MAVSDDERLWRRIHSTQLVGDKTDQKISSAAFKDPELSCDRADLVEARGSDWRTTLGEDPIKGVAVAELPVAKVRPINGLAVEARPLPENDAHAEIHGTKTQGVAKQLRGAVSQVYWP